MFSEGFVQQGENWSQQEEKKILLFFFCHGKENSLAAENQLNMQQH